MIGVGAARSRDGGRELYLYWRTADRDAAIDAVRAWQTRLTADVSGLTARVLVRADPVPGGGPRGPSTVMEVYRRDGGIDTALERRIVDDGGVAFARWIDGARHLEVFVPPPAAPP